MKIRLCSLGVYFWIICGSTVGFAKPMDTPSCPSARIYKVQKGDRLSEWVNRRKELLHLRQRVYGKHGLLQLFIRANRLKNPNHIYPGMRLRIPKILVYCEAPRAQVRVPASSRPAQQVYLSSKDTNLPLSEGVIQFDSLKNRIDFGLGFVFVNRLSLVPAFPQLYLSSRFDLGSSFELQTSIMGFAPRYSFVSGSQKATEGQVRLGVGYRFDEDHWFVGLGGRYFSFGYFNDQNNQMGKSLDGVLMLGYRTQIADCFEFDVLVEPRFSFQLIDAQSKYWALFQVGGFGSLFQMRYLLDRDLYVGSYLSFDSIELKWHSASKTNSFATYELGAGMMVGVGF